MKCKFCPNEINQGKRGFNSCIECKTEYHWIENELYCYSFYSAHNNTKYGAHFYPTHSLNGASYFYLIKYNDVSDIILIWYYLPDNITPFNFKEKLPLLLTFL